MSLKEILTMSSQIIIDEAKKNNFKTEIIDWGLNLFKIYFEKEKWVLFKNIDCWLNSSLSLKLSDNKKLTYKLLEEWKFIAKSLYFNLDKNENIDINSLWLKLPLVVKPIDESHWNWVTTKIYNQESLDLGINESKKFSKNIVIQEFQKWIETRILVINWKVIWAINREAAHIIWDWEKSIEELINIENKNPLRWEKDYTKPMNKIVINLELEEFIKKQWFKKNNVLPKDKKLVLRWISNMWAWWISIDVTDEISEDIKKLAIDWTKKLWLIVAGVDIISNDFRKNFWKDNSAIILEINATPSIILHHFPTVWKSRNAAKEILELIKNK